MEAIGVLSGPRGRRFVAEALQRARQIERPNEGQTWPWWPGDNAPELGPWVAEVSAKA